MIEKIETVIIGGGQAGLSLSYYLLQSGREHVILEKSSQVADAWRNHRWDSFCLVSPNWTFKLPGAEYTGSEPDGFMLKDEIVRRFEQYESTFKMPVRYSTEVMQVEPIYGSRRYRITTNRQIYESKNVVIATGLYHHIKRPAFAGQIPADIQQISSEEYRNPQALPPGAVLVVGSGQSGCQQAEEINEAGRRVFFSTSGVGRVPRRYCGIDGFTWLSRIGFFDRTTAMLSSSKDRFFAAPHMSGKGGGHDINLHKFSRDGIILLGHTAGYADGKLTFAPDHKANLAKSDEFAAMVLKLFDTFIMNNNLDSTKEDITILDDGYRAPVITSLDLAAENIKTIIWACGYLNDYSLVKLPILDEYNYPITDQGVTRYPGLYFLGMNWMNKFKSGFLLGIGESAQYLAEYIGKE